MLIEDLIGSMRSFRYKKSKGIENLKMVTEGHPFSAARRSTCSGRPIPH